MIYGFLVALFLAVAALLLIGLARAGRRGVALIVGGALALSATIYALRGAPELPARVAENPRLKVDNRPLPVDEASAETWQARGAALLADGRPRQAFSAFAYAEGKGAGAAAWIGQAEALIAQAGGMVTPAALLALSQAEKAAPGNPATAYYRGLARAQAGETEVARHIWAQLLAQAPEDAPYRARLEADLRALEGPPAAGPPALSAADVEAFEAMSAEDQRAFLETMLGRLAARLEGEPENVAGWIRVARGYQMLGNAAAAKAALERAAPHASEAERDIIEALSREIAQD